MSGIATVEGTAVERAHAAIVRDGVVHLKGIFSAETIGEAVAIAVRDQPALAALGEEKPGNDTGEGRYIASVPITAALRATGLFENEALIGLGNAALGPDHVVEAFGMMMSAVGSVPQTVHRDGVPMYPETPLDAMLPATALVILIPAIRVGPDGGATAFRLGSHRTASADTSDKDVHTADLEVGDALVWDYRTEHCGITNTSTQNRYAFHFTLARPFWIDHLNYNSEGDTRITGDAATIAALGPRFARATPV
ncbi:MAG: phytanoyl-CoA dioxygenase family protein [Erythrobacter sp.]